MVKLAHIRAMRAQEVLERARAREQREREILSKIRHGTRLRDLLGLPAMDL